MLRRPFFDPKATDRTFQIWPALEVKKRLNTSLMIHKGTVVVFECGSAEKSENMSNPVNEDHENLFLPVTGESMTVNLNKLATTAALEYNNAHVRAQVHPHDDGASARARASNTTVAPQCTPSTHSMQAETLDGNAKRKLEKEVDRRGGYDAVEKRREWRQIARAMDLPLSSSTSLRRQVQQQWIVAFFDL